MKTYTTEPIRSKQELKELAHFFLLKKQHRNYVMIILGSCTALRISDLLKLRWKDVRNTETGEFFSHITLTEKKTGKYKKIALSSKVIAALKRYALHAQGEYIFSNGRKKEKPISRVQAWRIIKAAVLSVGIQGKISCHSLRKTFGYHAYISGKVQPILLMAIFNHSSFETTKRYLGITQDEVDQVYLEIGLF